MVVARAWMAASIMEDYILFKVFFLLFYKLLLRTQYNGNIWHFIMSHRHTSEIASEKLDSDCEIQETSFELMSLLLEANADSVLCVEYI